MTGAPPADNHARQAAQLPTSRGISAATEDYLKAIYRLQQVDDRVTTLNLAGELGLSGPSVTNMVKRLADLSLVEHNRYHGVHLTESGNKMALEVIRHHRLLELYLAEALGYDWDKVHDEAERLEHHVSSELETRMDELLGHPEYDPHGDPIPSLQGEVPLSEWHRLSDEAPGAEVVLRRVSDRDSEYLRFLAEIGIVPGSIFELTDIDSTSGDRVISTTHGNRTIPLDLAVGMQVEQVAPD